MINGRMVLWIDSGWLMNKIRSYARVQDFNPRGEISREMLHKDRTS